MHARMIICTLLAAALAPGASAAAELELRLGGRLQTDLRLRTAAQRTGDFYGMIEAPAGVARNENIFKLKLDAFYGDYAGVVDVDFVWLGHSEGIETIGDLSMRQQVDPYYLQVHAAYLEVRDFLVDYMDLRVGQQLVQWGVGDQFNPTNNLNPEDLEDILLFGEQMANTMVRLDYAFADMWSVAGVLVPVFQPALLPRTAPLGLAAVDRMPMQEPWLRHRLHFENRLAAAAGYPVTVERARPELPDQTLGNMQFSFRLAGNLFGQDLALSYYRGRSDMPQPVQNLSSQVVFDERLCDPDAPQDDPRCIDGLLLTDVTLAYPRVQVAGLNLAGEIPLSWIEATLPGIGYRLELGVYFPEETSIALVQEDDVTLSGFTQPAGEYTYGLGGRRPLVVDDTPFVKWVLGLDYSFGPHVMFSLMWVHGMADEFGAGDFLHEGYVVRGGSVEGGPAADPMQCILDGIVAGQTIDEARQVCGTQSAVEILRPRLGDYLVLGADFKFAGDRALFRLFAIWDLSGYFEDRWDPEQGRRVRRYLSLFGDGFSAVIFPELTYNFGSGLELGAGALLQLGKPYTKFGDPAAGGHLVFTRARFSF